jgi:hypothetical protein
MTNQEIVRAYLRCFSRGDLDGLEVLLAPELAVKGPLLECHTAEQYLNALRKDPPQAADCTILSITEDDESVAVFYEYGKGGQPMTIAQLFWLRDERIRRMVIVFDARAMA